MNIERNRVHYAMITGVVIIVGLASRSDLSASWPGFLQEFTGDTLWTLMVFLGTGILFPKIHTLKVALITLLISYGVETLQLYHAHWIESIRSTFFGAVALGSGFLWSDFLCYTVGCLMGVAGEFTVDFISNKRIG